jgi:hypothetical protein
MAGSTERAAPEEGDSIDESAVVPLAKSYQPPLQECMKVAIDVSAERLTVKGEVNVNRSLREVTSYTLICATALATAIIAAVLCHAWRADGRVALAVSAGSAVSVLILGLAYTLLKLGRD